MSKGCLTLDIEGATCQYPNCDCEGKMEDIQILSKNHYQASVDTPCDWADDGHLIKAKRHYVRIVVKPADSDLQTQKVCLDCWMKP